MFLVLYLRIASSHSEHEEHRELLIKKRLERTQFVVLFRENVDFGEKLISLFGGRFRSPLVRRKYEHAFHGVVVGALPLQLMRRIMDDDDVILVEEDRYLTLQAAQRGFESIENPHRRLNLDLGETGKGVSAYILDSGINLDYREFGDRVKCGFSADDSSPCEDVDGHGTAVASVFGGVTHGVASEVDLISVKVVDDSSQGRLSDLLDGIEFVASQKKDNPSAPMVAVVSSSDDQRSTIMNAALDGLVSTGVVVIASAGNFEDNACKYSPASAQKVITVAAATATGDRESYSNYGACIDVFAPGNGILSTDIESARTGQEFSGTSMAASRECIITTERH